MEPRAYSYIRFSTPEQLKGDSLRRQLDASIQYAKDHDLTLDDSLNMRDLGLSAFHGAHRTRGALGQFLMLVEAGKIPEGSVLIVESLDRLSRQEVLEALNQFTAIIQAGIRLVTLQDNMEYTTASINENWTQLIISITVMARAYDESKRKSQRIKEAWSNKRTEAQNGTSKLTARCPLWLRLSSDRKMYVPIPEAVRAVELIFRLKHAGYGVTKIEHELNARSDVWAPPYNPKRKSKGWRTSYIKKILTSEAVIGVFTPHELVDGKRLPGDPISGYYPTVIPVELYYTVQESIRRNSELKGYAGGRTGKISNLFTHLAVCGLCKSPMHYVNKGVSSRGGAYLVCYTSSRKLECSAKPIKYEEFERLFFDSVKELNISELLPNQNELDEHRTELEHKITAGRHTLRELGRQVSNLTDTVASTDDPRVRSLLENKIKTALDERETLTINLRSMTEALQAMTDEIKQMQATIDTAREVYEVLSNCKTEQERINIRLKLRQEIRTLVKRIYIFPLQEPYKPIEEIQLGIYQTMNSQYIDRVWITFNGSRKRTLILQKSIIDTYYKLYIT